MSDHMKIEDALQIMGIEAKDATQDNVKATFKAWARRNHPDVLPKKGQKGYRKAAELEFGKMREAHDLLLSVLTEDIPLGMIEHIEHVAVQLGKNFIEGASTYRGLSDALVIEASINTIRTGITKALHNNTRETEKKRLEIELIDRLIAGTDVPNVVTLLWVKSKEYLERQLLDLEAQRQVEFQREKALDYLIVNRTTAGQPQRAIGGPSDQIEAHS